MRHFPPLTTTSPSERNARSLLSARRRLMTSSNEHVFIDRFSPSATIIFATVARMDILGQRCAVIKTRSLQSHYIKQEERHSTGHHPRSRSLSIFNSMMYNGFEKYLHHRDALLVVFVVVPLTVLNNLVLLNKNRLYRTNRYIAYA